MGRKTSKFGYQYGLEPWQPDYLNMEHHVFPNSLNIDKLSESLKIEKIRIEKAKVIRQNTEADIYLCGGGELAGWLLENRMIDQLKLKLNPAVLGNGTRLFGSSTKHVSRELIEKESFSGGI
jgi:dihydrofolate reductase